MNYTPTLNSLIDDAAKAGFRIEHLDGGSVQVFKTNRKRVTKGLWIMPWDRTATLMEIAEGKNIYGYKNMRKVLGI